MERSKLITTLHAKGYRVTSKGILLNPKGVIIKGRKDRDGYPIMGMRYYGKCYNVLIHRLQAFQKYGAKMFDKGMEVRHLNGIKDDNCWDNIAIGTHSENMMDIPEHIRIAKALHATSFVRKHNREEILKFHETNNSSYKRTMIEFGISSKGTLHFILNNKTK